MRTVFYLQLFAVLHGIDDKLAFHSVSFIFTIYHALKTSLDVDVDHYFERVIPRWKNHPQPCCGLYRSDE